MNIIMYNKRTIFKGDNGSKCEALVRRIYLEENEKAMTNEYFSLYRLFDDYYMISNYVDIDCKNKLRFGVMKLKRDEKGDIIPKNEEIIIPLIYELINYGNSKTIIGHVGKKQTYIELDIQSKNYLKNIIPPVVEKAKPFDEKYQGYAECKYNGGTYYIPRDIEITKVLDEKLLLKEEQINNKNVSQAKRLTLTLNKRKK